MKITPDIIRYEFTGVEGEVVKSPHQDYVKVGGKIVGETRNTFIFQKESRRTSVIKETAIFNFKFNDGSIVQIDGKLLVGRPEDRLKKNIKRLW